MDYHNNKVSFDLSELNSPNNIADMIISSQGGKKSKSFDSNNVW